MVSIIIHGSLAPCEKLASHHRLLAHLLELAPLFLRHSHHPTQAHCSLVLRPFFDLREDALPQGHQLVAIGDVDGLLAMEEPPLLDAQDLRRLSQGNNIYIYS